MDRDWSVFSGFAGIGTNLLGELQTIMHGFKDCLG